ncbi:preprotein translocase subunit SecA [Roseateles sp. DAIF2]|uniref:preprotein translocase subunit SecA n=1 Tax=Roseateles sp. DAIF2 TaxID=2714952 RepID=UPI0018A28BCA|nr:preprotein translocase subunit SecA [Roseateles sp. DAIF2]QPF74852.1 preprotein translocase subunit SecA [Roseateles sp. DAIF2]
MGHSSSSSSFALRFRADPYAQRRDWTELPWLDQALDWCARRLLRRDTLSQAALNRFVRQVRHAEAALQGRDAAALRDEAQALRRALGRQGFEPALCARAFALIRRHSHERLGLAHFDTQLKGAYVMLSARVLEMDTGEGKTLTASLAAAAAALAGLAVHVVTVNDYLAARDADKLRPLYEALGLTVAVVLEGDDEATRRQRYRADIVYCSNKTVVFDYLRDRQRLAERMQPLPMALDLLLQQGPVSGTTLRGLHFAIVDEADSVFIDEARTPLILSAQRGDEAAEDYYRQAIALARRMDLDQDATLGRQDAAITLTAAGRAKLQRWTQDLPPVWHARLRSEETLVQALGALHRYRRDEHYIVADGKVQIVDENTGRVMADRSWERGLHQMIEAKEGVALSAGRETLARISYQLFFRRYLRLAGMSGTVREVAPEVARVFGPGITRVAPRRPTRRRALGERLLPDQAAKWQAVAAAVRSRRDAGQPVLVGTRSIAASEALSAVLTTAGIEHVVLNAKQDADEAAIVEAAGAPGRVTIATNMAGRGTDIPLDEIARNAGGLHVLLTERHDNARVDRQLIGRCARQGDPGSWEALLSLDDELLRDTRPALLRLLKARLSGPTGQRLGLWLYRRAQRRTEAAHARTRQGLLKSDFQTRQSLSFSGQME